MSQYLGSVKTWNMSTTHRDSSDSSLRILLYSTQFLSSSLQFTLEVGRRSINFYLTKLITPLKQLTDLLSFCWKMTRIRINIFNLGVNPRFHHQSPSLLGNRDFEKFRGLPWVGVRNGTWKKFRPGGRVNVKFEHHYPPPRKICGNM